jgi:hypothetical protein
VDSDSVRLAAMVGHAAAAWSLAYGLLGLYWTLGGAGFPFGVENDPYAAKVSVLEHLRQDTAAPAIAVLGLGAALVALAMAHGRAQGLPGAVLLGFAWTMAVALAVVLPDVRPLTSLARTPIVLIGMPFGWPPGIGLSTLYPWPVLNQLCSSWAGCCGLPPLSPTSAGSGTPVATAAAPTPPPAGSPPPAPPAGADGRPWSRSRCPSCMP